MNLYSDEVKHKAGQHPGWAVRFEDGSWQTGGHGWHRGDVGIAERHTSIEDAHYNARRCQDDYGDNMPYEVVPAWEPLCEALRRDIRSLEKALKVSPDHISTIIEEMENLLYTLKETQK